MADDNKTKCKHPPCNCRSADGSDYCGVFCENAKDETEIVCECGHPPCI